MNVPQPTSTDVFAQLLNTRKRGIGVALNWRMDRWMGRTRAISFRQQIYELFRFVTAQQDPAQFEVTTNPEPAAKGLAAVLPLGSQKQIRPSGALAPDRLSQSSVDDCSIQLSLIFKVPSARVVYPFHET